MQAHYFMRAPKLIRRVYHTSQVLSEESALFMSALQCRFFDALPQSAQQLTRRKRVFGATLTNSFETDVYAVKTWKSLSISKKQPLFNKTYKSTEVINSKFLKDSADLRSVPPSYNYRETEELFSFSLHATQN